jgi:hypothetical protein
MCANTRHETHSYYLASGRIVVLFFFIAVLYAKRIMGAEQSEIVVEDLGRR